jgi:hypothetical protein
LLVAANSRNTRRRADGWSLELDRKTERQLALEGKRQDLRDQRWRRERSMIVTTTLCAGLFTGTVPIKEVIGALAG